MKDAHHHHEALVQTGLTPSQAAIYGALLSSGELPASKVAHAAKLSRPLTYKVLEELVAQGLVEKHDAPKSVALFKAAHPLKLQEMADRRLETAKNAKNAYDAIVRQLTMTYNIQNKMPGVRFYEGLEGVKECIDDALGSRTEILSYVDIAAVEREVPDISRDFAKARRKLGLKKRNIGIDTPENRAEIEGYYSDVTEERLIPWPTASFGTVMQIYDGKVSYITLGEHMMGVIVADPSIYEMHRSLFEFAWNNPLAYVPGHDQAASAEGSVSA